MVRVGEIAANQPLSESDKAFVKLIQENNKTHIVDKTQLAELLVQAQEVYAAHFDKTVWFERSIFTNWTCGIADCKYCYLSTKPKLDMSALRSQESILAEALLMNLMGWRVGYITGGLRVESTPQMIQLLQNLAVVLGEKPMMNFGPYTKTEVAQLAPFVSGMGSAIESFDPDLHRFICPSKPLSALLKFLGYLQEQKLKKLITIILGIGEKMSDVDQVIAYVKQYEITTVQLCFLKPQEYTVFAQTSPPNPDYMAWWCAKLRIACPDLIIKIALVKDRIGDFSLMLRAGANCFSRYMVFSDFASSFATELEVECQNANRELAGNFSVVPQFDIEQIMSELALAEDLKDKIKPKLVSYIKRLEKLAAKNNI